jgi:hypothetical protein
MQADLNRATKLLAEGDLERCTADRADLLLDGFFIVNDKGRYHS